MVVSEFIEVVVIHIHTFREPFRLVSIQGTLIIFCLAFMVLFMLTAA